MDITSTPASQVRVVGQTSHSDNPDWLDGRYGNFSEICLVSSGLPVQLIVTPPPGVDFRSGICAFVLLASVILFMAPFTSNGRRRRQWVRVALGILGLFMLAWSALGLILLFSSIRAVPQTYRILYHIRGLFAGASLGILILLFASGEVGQFRTNRKP